MSSSIVTWNELSQFIVDTIKIAMFTHTDNCNSEFYCDPALRHFEWHITGGVLQPGYSTPGCATRAALVLTQVTLSFTHHHQRLTTLSVTYIHEYVVFVKRTLTLLKWFGSRWPRRKMPWRHFSQSLTRWVAWLCTRSLMIHARLYLYE